MKRNFILLGALLCFMSLTASNTHWKTFRTENSNIPSNSVMSVCACNNQIVVGTNAGLGLMDISENWDVFNHTNSSIPDYEIRSVLNQNGEIWAATYGGGLIKKSDDPQIESLTSFNMNNSPIPTNSLNCVIKDKNNNIWVGTSGHGLVKYDGSNWTIYNTQNSNIPGNNITAIHVNANNELILGTYFNGFSRFDGYNWLNYNTNNSALPTNEINNIYMDGHGVLWISTRNGLVRYDGANWNIYNEHTTFYLFNQVNDALADEDGNIWFATTRGLGKIDSSLTVSFYRSDNSGLERNYIYDLHIDQHNNIWIATLGGGLTVYNEDQLVLNNDEIKLPKDHASMHVYPNPATSVCLIDAKINPREFSTLRVYNQEGRIIKEINPNDSYSEQIKVRLDVSDLAKGMYIVELNNNDQIMREKLIVL